MFPWELVALYYFVNVFQEFLEDRCNLLDSSYQWLINCAFYTLFTIQRIL